MCLRTISKPMRRSEDGNVFMAIFGAIALVGLLGASIMTFMKGPLTTSVKLTKMNTAENQMSIGAQVAVMATASQANNGDCELIDPDGAGPLPAAGDGFVEPIPFRVPTTEPVPVGGGLVPLTLGISKKDPWATEYGYCVWNHGPSTAANGCDTNMLAGTNSRSYAVVALISAGPDKAFTTTCRSFADADVNGNGDLLDPTDLPMAQKAAETDDDIITTFTYEEATGASGGLWSLKAGEPGTAVIGKNIEATGVADLKGGVLLPDKSFIDCTDVANTGVMAKSALGIEICDGSGAWTSIGGASGALSTSATCAAPADAGNVRFNSVSGQPEFCNGTTWLPFTINVPGVNLVITPNTNNAMNVNGAVNADPSICTVASNMICGADQIFTVTNQGTLTSSVVSARVVQVVAGVTQTVTAASLTSPTNASNFVSISNTCNTTLAPNATCIVRLRPKALGNTTYTADLRIIGNNNPIALMQGSSTNFGCLTGRVGGGGNYLSCGQNDGDGPYNLVIMPSGCNGSTTNPSCTGTDTGAVSRTWGAGGISIPQVCTTNQICKATQDSVNIEYLRVQYGYSFPANSYCQDMIFNGYTDWYLPDQWELQTVLYNAIQAGRLTGFSGDYYYTATLSSNSPTSAVTMYRPSDNRVESYYDSPQMVYSRPVRCVRREDLPLRATSTDNDPDDVTFGPKTSFISGSRLTSASVAVGGFLQPVAVAISGGSGTPRIKINGGAETPSGTINPGQTVTLVMDAPTVLGTKNTATVTIGPDTYTWWTGYADQTREMVGFVTSTTYSGTGIGGLGGGDAICNARAAASPYGLSAKYKFLASNSSINASERIPWNWGTLKMVDGTVIVNGGISDLFDGSIITPLNITELGTVGTNYPWTGTLSSGQKDPGTYSGSNNGCADWTGNQYSYATGGSSGSSSGSWVGYGGLYCSDGRPLICVEDIDNVVVDNTPSPISPPYAIQVTASSRQVTSAIVISGMRAGATTTLSVASTGGNPTFTVNGGAEVTSGTVQNGSSVVFYMDAPATASSSYKMTISSSSPTTAIGYWRVWTGDATGSAVKRVFVTTATYGGNLGGPSGADTKCQSQAATAALGGTWKAIISGFGEAEWAVNRIGYNWSTLRLVDGSTIVANAGGLWLSGSGQNLLAPINKTQSGVIVNTDTFTNTNPNGGVLYASSASNGCYDFTSNNNDWNTGIGRTGSTGPAWIQGGSMGGYPCSDGHSLFCIEQ